jgi:hypothetical protein
MGKTIYTMPEKFMKDESVPVKWRLYGLVNGFWINGLPVYASNGFFAEKLNCTERHISRAFEELEKEGLLTRNINGYKRLILQGGMTPDVRGGGHGASIYPDVGGQPNASSNASNLTISAEGAEERVVKEKKDTTYLQVFALWGKYPLNWRQNTTEIQAAKNLLEEHGLEDCQDALKFYGKHKHEEKCPQILKPSDLDRKWVNLEAHADRI